MSNPFATPPQSPNFSRTDAVYDYNWKIGGVNKQKLIFISCVSDELPIRKKMMYGSSKEQV